MKLPELNPVERYVGRINNMYTILLLGDNDYAEWQAAIGWAKSIGGDQYDLHKGNSCRTRAVRRITIGDAE